MACLQRRASLALVGFALAVGLIDCSPGGSPSVGVPTAAGSASQSELISDLQQEGAAPPIPPLGVTNPVVIPDSMIQQNIDAAIQGPERQIVALAMLSFPTWLRTNVVVIGADGSEYVNHATLRGMWQTSALQVPSFAHRADGTVEPQALALPPGTSGGSGAFRRAYSDSAADDHFAGGYTGLVSSVSIPCGTISNLSINMYPFKENQSSGYTYIEGLDDNNHNFEVGFGYYPDATPPHLVQYYRIGDGKEHQVLDAAHRYPCGNYKNVMGFVPVRGRLIGVFWASSAPGAIPVATKVQLEDTYHWSPSDASARVATMTTIAQAGTQDLANGAYFGLDETMTSPQLSWQSIYLAACPRFARICRFNDAAKYKWSYQNYPTNNLQPNRPADSLPGGNRYIKVADVSNAHEVDGIVLPSPSPSPSPVPTAWGGPIN